jgi:hypothetical protein
MPLPRTVVIDTNVFDQHAYHFAITAAGTLRAWGDNSYGQCNVPSSPCAFTVAAAGLWHGVAATTGGNVLAWGYNYYGQTNVPGGLTNVVSVSAGASHCLALKGDGSVVAWGRTDVGACNVPADLTNAVAIAAGANHSLALRADATVVAWGRNDDGESTVPPGLTNVVAVSAGNNYSMALTADGAVVPWGWNGNNTTNVPADLPPVKIVNAGWSHVLALVSSPPPTILANPSSQTLPIGATANLLVRALAVPPVTYQWYFGTNAIPAATKSTLTLTNLQPSHSGAYSVVVSNEGGAKTSAPAMLSVLPALDIQMVPALTMQGQVGVTYSVQYVNVVGPTNAWVTLADVTLTNNPQFYCDLSAIGQPARFYRLLQAR